MEEVLGETIGGYLYTAGRITSFAGATAGGIINAATGAAIAPSVLKCGISVAPGYLDIITKIEEQLHGESSLSSVSDFIEGADTINTVVDALFK
jgi:hypothetical protein